MNDANETVIKELTTPEGVKVSITDLTRNYGYQNIYEVRLKVTATFPGTSELFEHTLEKLGVFAEELDAAREELVESFLKAGLPYLTKSGFADKLEAKRKSERRPAAVKRYA